ncbi:hypothetical protein OIE13_05895 [Streptosporangium sp. NBC_01810]|uniref:hypothetical protein n=1 Tax=Streptosporangium sp. NBC_01810 TaxID=2975951 RepID=UPI002DDB31C8|nr:hypothetical protein [Streptosporangium sp. NBC_01810]WSA27405.1 hypothetical protein OIE13_05895 [Streptosporangium sp. NBC_01810]
MIPADGRPVDAAGAADIMGMAYQTFRNKRIATQEGAPAPFNPGSRKLLYDAAQWEAYRAGRELPTRPARMHPHPDDLLDGPEAAAYLGVDYGTVRRYQKEERLTVVEVCGVPHFRRHALDARRDNPGRPGRPPNAAG